MARPNLFLVFFVVSAGIAASGCVPIPVYYEAVKKNEDLQKVVAAHQAKHADLTRKNDEATSKSQFLEIENNRLKEINRSLEGRVKRASEELLGLLKEGVQKELPVEVAGGEVQITEEGKVSIAGDVLFPSGSAELTEKAKGILKKLVPILSDPKFKDTYIRVEGHTDDQPIVRVKEKFPTNWHLSVARAVSVLMQLKELGIPEARIYAAGYGEFKPRVPNAPGRKGAAANRRVEIAVMETK